MSVVAAVAGLAALNYFTLQHQLNNLDSTTSVCQAVNFILFVVDICSLFIDNRTTNYKKESNLLFEISGKTARRFEYSIGKWSDWRRS